jgi:hypothetical protein
MTLQLAVRSHPGRVMLSWIGAGWKAGLCLGGIYGLVLGGFADGMFLPGLAFGVGAGIPIGGAAGLLNGTFLGVLARPLGLDSGSRPARARAAAAAAAVTSLLLLPLLIATTIPLALIVPPVVASILTAGAVAVRIPPAGRPADRKALIRIEAF